MVLTLASCTIVQKAPKHKPYLIKNSYEVKCGDFSKTEKSALETRMANQLDDSSKISSKTFLFFVDIVNRPPTYDTGYSNASALNIENSMMHLGYYDSKVNYKPDTAGRKVSVHYSLDVGKKTVIDTIVYNFENAHLDSLVRQSMHERIILKGNPITKAAVLGEEARLVDSFRNNGYYKFTAGDLRMLGDTTVAVLTQVSDDPFEQLQLLAEAQALRDSPRIKLQLALRNPEDSVKYVRYKIGRIYLLEDYAPTDRFDDTIRIVQREGRNFILRYKRDLFRTRFLARNVAFRPGDYYSQKKLNQTLTNLSKTGVFDNVNVNVIDRPTDSLLDLVVELMPAKKFGFEAALEGSYSAVSNTNNALAGNLFGLSANFSLTNRNVAREGIKMTHAIRLGVEFNNRKRSNATQLVNSTEASYSNKISIPRILSPLPSLNNRAFQSSETFMNTMAAFNKRLGLFNMQNFMFNTGWSWNPKKNRFYTVRVPNIEFSYLYNESDSFLNKILPAYPFLRYTYNTALVMGMSASYSSIYNNPYHPNSASKERSFKLNAEESGLTWGAVPVFKKYKRRYFKTDVEYKYSVNYSLNNALVLRAFTGVGVPVGKEDQNRQLPFFKQYFGGGSNSMRGWPLRGIGRGGQALTPYKANLFNDRTGDMQIELNAEYRYVIARIIPNTLTLRGAVFTDMGNIWNIRKDPTVAFDSAQFKFSNLYSQMGISAGTGFRLDFNFFIVRADLGFRLKKPELSHINDGWSLPSLSFNDILPKMFSSKEEYRLWRYNNFNFTIGISYPF